MAPPGRLVGIDVARALAILGMLWAHFAPDGTRDGLADGRSSVLFATLAGVSLGLITGGASPVRDRRRARITVALRAFWLILLGRGLWALGTPIAVILDYYGVVFLLLLPVLFARRRVLVAVAGVAAVGGAALIHAVGPDLDAAFGVSTPLLWPGQWLVTGWYPAVLWTGYVAVGLLLARSDLARRRTQLGMVAGGALSSVVGYGGAAVLGQDAAAHSDTTWEALGSGGIAVAVTGVLLFACTAPQLARALSPLADVGAMPLTIYTGQLVALAVFLLAPHDFQDWGLLAGIAIGSVVFAVAWRRTVGRGPMEQLMASLTDVGLHRAREDRALR